MSKREVTSKVRTKDFDSDIEIEVNLLKNKVGQIPGCVPVKISNYEYPEEKIKFFGVEKRNSSPEGVGVTTYQKEFKQAEGVVAWFNIRDLIEHEQYTEEVEEIVIKVGEVELGREEINIPPAVYLG